MPPAPSHPSNRLAREASPYLLQHQHNPVDWYPWGTEAFERARSLNRPIFLSIGYSTCHWCHVMERESFEQPRVAALLNDGFVSIKVDREERPDVDRIYMTFVQATTGSGGWPLNVFLTPDLRPFLGGTYFPPDERHGRLAFPTVLEQVLKLWTERREELEASAEELHLRLETLTQTAAPESEEIPRAALAHAAAQAKAEYDPAHGGFGGAPKFPRPTQPALLLRVATRQQDTEAIRQVLHTCERMAAGGIQDQLGGGFHRYAVDAQWLVPHFEKMLYDNAQLVQLYLDAYLVSRNPSHAKTARDIICYVLRDLTHPDGGFYSAEDADSEGQEGKFYCWTKAELSALLAPEEFNVVVHHYGITDDGNFIDHSHPHPLPGLNVLHLAQANLSQPDQALLDSARAKMLAARARRIRPHCDDKVLASWNGLMLGAIARAAVVLDEPTFHTAAARNLAFLQNHLWDARTHTLHHRWRNGHRDDVQLLDAYAFLLHGTIEKFESTLDPAALEFACALADAMIARFEDPEIGGFFQGANTTDLILRLKSNYDGAEPSGNSVAALALLRLAAITERDHYRASATRTLRALAPRLAQAPETLPLLLLALDFSLHPPTRIVITGDPHHPQAQALLRAAHSVYQPNKVILGQAGPVCPLAIAQPRAAYPTACICTSTACLAPVQTAEALAQALQCSSATPSE